MDIEVQELPARIVGGPSILGYAVICNSKIHNWYQDKAEAERIAELLRIDSTNPEDY
tara:strand:- start:1979 stop:2149 length:171 start_codon:yes stop_codon:yes gene_type:complete